LISTFRLSNERAAPVAVHGGQRTLPTPSRPAAPQRVAAKTVPKSSKTADDEEWKEF
jgi:hypothetical protein